MVGERYERFDEFVQNSIISELHALVKVWSKDGKLLYTSDPSDTEEEKDPMHESHLPRVLAGVSAAHIHDSDNQGTGSEALLSLPLSAVHPDETPQLRAFAQSVFVQGYGWTDELTCMTRHGQALSAEISASFANIFGRSCMIASVRDVTERRQAEEALRKEGDFNRRLIDFPPPLHNGRRRQRQDPDD